MTIRSETITATPAAGGAGVSTVTATSTHPFNGKIVAVHLAYLDAPPAGTTDVIIAWKSSGAPAILTITNSATDAWYYPKAAVVNEAGAAFAGVAAEIPIDDYLTVKIDQANVGDGVTAIIVWDDGRD